MMPIVRGILVAVDMCQNATHRDSAIASGTLHVPLTQIVATTVFRTSQQPVATANAIAKEQAHALLMLIA